MNRETYDLAVAGRSPARLAAYHKLSGVGWIGITFAYTAGWPVILGAGYTLTAAPKASREWRTILSTLDLVEMSPASNDIYRLAYGNLFSVACARTSVARDLLADIRATIGMGEAVQRLSPVLWTAQGETEWL